MRYTSVLCQLAGIAVVALAIYSGGLMGSYLSIPGLLMVVVGSLLLTFVSVSPGDLGRAFACALGREDPGPARLHDARAIIRGLGANLAGLGILGFFIGAVNLLRTLDKPSDLGPGLAAATNCMLYAVVLLAAVVTPAEIQIGRRLATHEDVCPGAGRYLLLLLGGVAALLPLVSLLYSFVDRG